MISIEEAWRFYAQHVIPIPPIDCEPVDALFSVLAQDVFAQTDLPRFDQSAMDGYALRAQDSQRSLVLPISQHIAAGAQPRPLDAGTAARLFTGAAIPAGADTVIPQERTEADGQRIQLTEAWPVGKNIRYRAEETRHGDRIAALGSPLTPGLVAALVNADVTRIIVRRMPRIALLVTGNEVVPAGTPRSAVQIADSNGPLVQGYLRQWGYPAPPIHYCSDAPDSVRDHLTELASTSDLVITTGGASVGEHDQIPAVADQLGFTRIFWKVAQKPGKPLWFGVRSTGALLALPGNPGAVLIGMLLHVRRVLALMMGQTHPAPHSHPGFLAQPCRSDTRRPCLHRMQRSWDDRGRVMLHPLPKQDSHMLGNLARAEVLVWLPASLKPLEAGTEVRWMDLNA